MNYSRRKIDWEHVGFIIVVIGMIIGLGTGGSDDLGSISTKQFFVQMAIAIALIIGGIYAMKGRMK